MPRTKVPVSDVAEVAPGLWSNAIRAGDMLFISGQVARPFEGGTGIVSKDEYEQTRQIFSRIDRIVKAAGGTMDDLVKMTRYQEQYRGLASARRVLHRRFSRFHACRSAVACEAGSVGRDRNRRLSRQELK
jgi:enamine deaminase RidA (YjgF/YER057c/UK114 family)